MTQFQNIQRPNRSFNRFSQHEGNKTKHASPISKFSPMEFKGIYFNKQPQGTTKEIKNRKPNLKIKNKTSIKHKFITHATLQMNKQQHKGMNNKNQIQNFSDFQTRELRFQIVYIFQRK